MQQDRAIGAICDLLLSSYFTDWKEFFQKYPELKAMVEDNELFKDCL